MDAKIRTRMESVKRMADDPRTPEHERANAKARYDAMVAKYGAPAGASTTRTNHARTGWGAASADDIMRDINRMAEEIRRRNGGRGFDFGRDMGARPFYHSTGDPRARPGHSQTKSAAQEEAERRRREAEKEEDAFAEIRRRAEEAERQHREHVNAMGIVERSRAFLEGLGCVVMHDPKTTRWAVFREGDTLLAPTNAIEMVNFARRQGFR